MKINIKTIGIAAGAIVAVLAVGGSLQVPVMNAAPWAPKSVVADIDSAKKAITLVAGTVRKNRLELKQILRAGVRRDLYTNLAAQEGYRAKGLPIPRMIIEQQADMAEEMEQLGEQIKSIGAQQKWRDLWDGRNENRD